jgi:hypothetical protein
MDFLHHHKVWIQQFFQMDFFPAFWSQYSNIPLFHHSMWLLKVNDHNKYNTFKNL